MDVNAHIRAHLEHAIAAGRLAHALIFAGARGVGKRRMALWLAQRLNCDHAEGSGAPCGACRPCERVERGVHPDVMLIVPEAEDAAASAEKRASGKTPKRIISIEQVRRLGPATAFAPYEGRARALVFDPADSMEDSGMNALLKLIEEPPPKTYLAFVTSRPEALLPTIRSRAQRFLFRETPLAAVRDALVKEKGLSPERAHWMAAMAQGSVERALAWDAEALAARRERCLKALLGIGGARGALAAVEAAEALSRSEGEDEAVAHREAAKESLEFLSSFLRDMLVLCAASNPGAAGLVHPDLAARLREAARAFPAETLLDAAALAEEAVRAVDGNVERRLAMEHFFFSLRRAS